MNTEETKALQKFNQAVAAIVALGFPEDVQGAITMNAASIQNFVLNRALERDANLPSVVQPEQPAPIEGVEGVDTAEPTPSEQ